MRVALTHALLQFRLLQLWWLFCNIWDSQAYDSLRQKALDLMREAPLIDGHNDLPVKLRWFYENKLSKIDLRTLNTTQTNIQKLQAGHVGAQFWSVYVPCDAQDKNAVHLALEQIDVIKRMCENYEELELVTSAQGIDYIGRNKIACLIGLEGGHSIDSSLATLRIFYELGVRYMMLTHDCNTPWAQSSLRQTSSLYADTYTLTGFGEEVVKEMNRLGMIIDLSHTSDATALAVLRLSKAPVIFSHSSAFSLCNHTGNIPDHILYRLKRNNGIVMVTFYAEVLTCGKDAVNILTVADHFDHIRTLIGSEHIGISGDYDGGLRHPEGLEDVSKYPALIEELLRRGWSEEELKDVLRENFLRVFREVEKVRDENVFMIPNEEEISQDDVDISCHQDLKPPSGVAILN
uniref:Dipeptidase n=1 Tax=Pogona vitticeps TaxID=103695 RepID=A0ABM5EUS5_9SAUR